MVNIRKSHKRGGSSDETTPLRRSRRRSPSDAALDDVGGLSSPQRAGNSSSHRNGFPEWLVENILIRLPSKSAVRFKLVCKEWASLISNPFFARSYLSRYPPLSWTVVEENLQRIPGNLRPREYEMPDDVCFSRQDFGNLRIPSVRMPNWRETRDVLASSNGLLLVGLVYIDETRLAAALNRFYVCDPVTRSAIRLSPLPPEFISTNWRGFSGFIARVEDASLKSFRVVLVSPDAEPGCSRFVVYCSDSRRWRGFLFSGGEAYRRRGGAACLDDEVLLWDSPDGSVLACRPYENPPRASAIAPPDDVDSRDERRGFRTCDASGGKLRYLEASPFRAAEADNFSVRIKLWVLEDYESGAWRLSHESIDAGIAIGGPSALPLVNWRLMPVFFDPFDPKVLYLAFRNRLFLYDVRGGGRFKELRESLKISVFALKLSPWPISIAACS